MNKILYKTMKHFFPGFRTWIKEMKDPRNKESITYELGTMIWVGIFLFLFKLESRRQINYELNSEEMIKNLTSLSKAKEMIERIPYDGTLAYLLKRLKPKHLERLRTRMINSLLRKKCLVNYRLFSYYLIAVDGSGHLAFKHRHCKHCLTKKRDGKVIYYYHPILEAKLVMGNGMSLSIATEFVENMKRNADKQDCELRAFHRLEKRIKKEFPQLRICLLLDGLYANEPVFDVCRRNRWKYMITFKEGSMPETFREYEKLKELSKENRGKYEIDGVKQNYRWVKDIDYKGHMLNVLECKESKIVKGKREKKRFVWLINMDIDEYNYCDLANKGGRLRWKIENEGFNMQKNGGYNMEHLYCKDLTAMKNFYLLLQIAHIFNQLMEKGSLLKAEIKKLYGSIRNFTRRLLESMRTSVLSQEELESILSEKFQIRFDTS